MNALNQVEEVSLFSCFSWEFLSWMSVELYQMLKFFYYHWLNRWPSIFLVTHDPIFQVFKLFYIFDNFWYFAFPNQIMFFGVFFLMFVYFWERVHMCEGEADREGERTPSSSVLSAQSPRRHGARSCETMTWAEIKSQMLNQPSHPDTAPNQILNETLIQIDLEIS